MEEKYLAPAVLRAFSVLEYIAEQGKVGFGELMDAIDIPRSSLSHILNTLSHLGYIRQQKGLYVVSSKIHEISNIVLSKIDIRTVALPIMRDLVKKVDFSCNLGTINVSETIYVAKVENRNAFMSLAWAGKRIPLMTSSLGKALLSMLPNDQVLAMIEANPTFQTSGKAVPSIADFMEELERVRSLGWASEDDSVTDGISCIGVPLRNGGDLRAALSISGDSLLMKKAPRDSLIRELEITARRIVDAMNQRF